MDITFRDQSGNPVQVVSENNPAIIMRKIPESQQKETIEAYKRGIRSIPWYYYNEKDGIWERARFDANVILLNEDVDGDGVQEEVAYAQVPITHTSWYNLDWPLNSTELCFQGKVLDANGKPASGLYVIAYSSSSYAYTRTDEKGEFKLYVPQAKFYRCLEWGQECERFCWGQNCWDFCWTSCKRYSDEILEYWRYKVFASNEIGRGIRVKERTRVIDISTEGKERYKCHDIGVLPPPDMYSVSCLVKDSLGNALVGAVVVSSEGKVAETDNSGKFNLISRKGNLVLTVSYEKDGFIYKVQKNIYVDKDITERDCSIEMRLEPVKVKCSAFINQKPGEIEVFAKGNNVKTSEKDGTFEISLPRPVDKKEEDVRLLYVAKFPDGSTEWQEQIIKIKAEDQVVVCDQGVNFEYNEVCVKGRVENEEGKGIRGVYVLVGGRAPVVTDESGFFEVQGGRAKKNNEGKYLYKVKHIYFGVFGKEEIEKEYEAKGTECIWEEQEIDTRPAWVIGVVRSKRGKGIGGAKVETEFGQVDYTNAGGQFKLKAPVNSKVKIYASYGGATTEVEVQTKEKGSTASVDIILNIEDLAPKVKVIGLGKAKAGSKLRFKIEVTDDSEKVGYEIGIKDWGFGERGEIKLEGGVGMKEFEIEVPVGARSADLEIGVKDEGGNEDKVLLKVEVTERNREPEILRIDIDGEIWIGGRFIASVVGYDPEGDQMSYEWGITREGGKEYGSWIMGYGATAVVEIPEEASGGIYFINVRVRDSEGGERSFVREINITKKIEVGERVCIPTDEICDGKDNDCNGLIDDGVLLVFYKDLDQDGYTDGTMTMGCSAPTGYVSSATSGDCNDNDPNINPGKAEICDSKDNNCNGQIDDGFNVGQICSVGIGECAREGQLICKADGSGTECNVSPGEPTTEICDGKDNDCDGQTDEDNVCLSGGTGGGGDSGGIGGGMSGARLGAGGYHTCAIKEDGSLWCWGANWDGQLGDGGANYPNTNTPVQIMSSGVVAVSLGGYHTCAIKEDGSLWCWGRNDSGQLGDGTNTTRYTPVQIMSSGVSAVSLGLYHTCAIKEDGSLWCWGDNYYGQLGDGTNTNKNTPVQIMPSGVSAVSLGDEHTCAIKQDGSLWCWGRNDYGQLGDGTYSSGSSTPVQIMSSGVSAVSLGEIHTCAIKQDASLWCWGRNYDGQLGDGTAWRNTPTYIMNLGSGGGSAPYIVKISGEFEEISGKGIRERVKFGCSSANFAYYFIYLIFPALILFALRKFKLKSNK